MFRSASRSHRMDPIVPLTFLGQLHEVLESYIGGPATESSLKDHFDIVLPLLDEMLASDFDVTETLSVILSPTSTVLSGTLTGTIACRSKLSGMPDLVLSFADPTLLDDMATHACVRSGRWRKDKVISFIPPEGAFTLLTYLVPFPSSPSSSSTSPLLPFSLKPLITQGLLGGTFSLSLTARSLAPLAHLKLRFPLGKNVTGVTGAVSGGGFPGVNGKGGGAGRPPNSRTAPALTVSFECPDGGFSGIRIAGLKVAAGSEQYSVYKGVRVRGKGEAEVRCF
ncbi:hypothetical protein RQP46_008527 [Phenoliferia psychrophenolica]